MRWWTATLLALVCWLAAGSPAQAAPVLIVNGRVVDPQPAPVVVQGRTLVPLRGVFEALGARVDWDGTERTVTVVGQGVTLCLGVGQTVAYRNGQAVRLEVPARIVAGRVLVPARFVSEALGARVDWDALRQAVVIVTASAADELQVGETRHQHREVSAGSVSSVSALLQMGTGELVVSGGAGQLMEADFTYNVEGWEPEVSYVEEGSRGVLEVRQPATSGTARGEVQYRWQVAFSDRVPLDLRVHTGVGPCRLELGSLLLRSLQVTGGVGDTTLDLRGYRGGDLRVSVAAGVGEVTVLLPREGCARVRVDGGVGGVSADGLRLVEDEYLGGDCSDPGGEVYMQVRAGVGRIHLER